jgi:hypothetical protein
MLFCLQKRLYGLFVIGCVLNACGGGGGGSSSSTTTATTGSSADTGSSGSGISGPSATASLDGMLMCTLGWAHLEASAQQQVVSVEGDCDGNAKQFRAVYSPLPMPGGSASPVSSKFVFVGGASLRECPMQGSPTGKVTVNGSVGNLTVSGTCNCNGGTVEFSNIPLMIQ